VDYIVKSGGNQDLLRGWRTQVLLIFANNFVLSILIMNVFKGNKEATIHPGRGVRESETEENEIQVAKLS